MCDILKKINLLPEEITLYIKNFLSDKSLLLTNKKDYEENIMKVRFLYHNKLLCKNFLYNTETGYYSRLDSYINYLIKNDFHYVFGLLIHYKYKQWINIKRYRYKGYLHRNYLEFLNHLCITSESTKCRNILKKAESFIPLLRKKRHKKIRHINNTWTN